MREKLIDVCEQANDELRLRSGCSTWGDFADHLIANGVTIQRWIPVTERLPEEGEEVLVFGYWHEKFQPLMCYLSPHRKGEWFTTVAGQQVYSVTNWMPLPEPPKGG